MTGTTAGLALNAGIVGALARRLPIVAEHTVAAIIAEVPSYSDALSGPMGDTIQGAVETALQAFLSLARQQSDADPSTPLRPAVRGAYALGRGEARSGRTAEALLAAYRVGARVSWRDLSATALRKGLPAADVAEFASLVFAYIDELSAASVSGHTDETLNTGRVRQRYLDALGRALVAGADPDVLHTRAERAGWSPPEQLTGVLVPVTQARPVIGALDRRTLQLAADETELGDADTAVLLVPGNRAALLHRFAGTSAVVGPTRPWTEVGTSVQRARRTQLLVTSTGEPVDSDEHLVALALGADEGTLADLRARVLAPLDGLRPSSRIRATETLRSWLLLQGRREEVAADLHVHPQTVRYWMDQVRELFGETLNDPARVQELVIALAVFS